MIAVARELGEQEGPRLAPVPLERALADVEQAGDLLQVEPGEEAQLHDLRQPRALGLQPFECGVEGQQIKTWGDPETKKPDQTLANFIDNANNLRPSDYAPDLKVAAANVEALNAATANIPADRMRMHVCWGNYEGPHDHDIALEKIVDIVIGARPATILFEAANPRHEHEWIVWRDAALPDHKILAPGMIDTCSNYLEHPELVAQRIERFAGIVGADRVIASTDCGFGTFAGYGKIDLAVTWKKLAALREGADIAAARL